MWYYKDMSSILVMAGIIEVSGVRPCAYDKFVDTVVDKLTPTQPMISNSYRDVIVSLGRLLLAFVILVIVATIVVIVFLFAERGGNINLACAITIVLVTVVLAVAMWYALTSLLGRDIGTLAPKVQKDVSNTALYAFNSAVRDAFFLTLCK